MNAMILVRKSFQIIQMIIREDLLNPCIDHVMRVFHLDLILDPLREDVIINLKDMRKAITYPINAITIF
jgi:hypothetical protein